MTLANTSNQLKVPISARPVVLFAAPIAVPQTHAEGGLMTSISSNAPKLRLAIGIFHEIEQLRVAQSDLVKCGPQASDFAVLGNRQVVDAAEQFLLAGEMGVEIEVAADDLGEAVILKGGFDPWQNEPVNNGVSMFDTRLSKIIPYASATYLAEHVAAGGLLFLVRIPALAQEKPICLALLKSCRFQVQVHDVIGQSAPC